MQTVSKNSQLKLSSELSLSKNVSYRMINDCFGRGSRDGAVVRALASHQCGPGSIPGVDAISWLSLLLVLVPAPRVFLRVPPQKQTFPNSNSTWTQWTKSHSVDVLLKFLFIYLLIYLFIYLFIYLTKNGFTILIVFSGTT